MRFQNKVASSTLTLPTVIVYAVVVCLVTGMFTHVVWMSLPAIAASTFCMMEMNNRNILLRIRSRMVSASYLALTLMTGYVLTDVGASMIQLCVVGMTFLLMMTLQDRRSQGIVFYVFVLLGLASLSWVRILWLVPLILVMMVSPLYSMSFRSLSAMILGLLMPYALFGAYRFYLNDYTWWVTKFIPLYDVSAFLEYGSVSVGEICSFFVMIVLILAGTFHFIKYSYEDKIRVRMLYWMQIVMAWFLVTLIALFPLYANHFLPMLCVPAAVLSAHFFAHTSTKISNAFFIVILFLVVIVTVLQLVLQNVVI